MIATIGFVLATRFFGTNYKQVAWHHGQLGIAILVLIYSQVQYHSASWPASLAPDWYVLYSEKVEV